MKISKDAHIDIIEAYTIDLWPATEIAEVIGCTRMAIYNLLKKYGVDTSGGQIAVSCTTCGVEMMRTRKRVRTQRNHFCSTDCYTSFLDAGKTSSPNERRRGQRRARAVVSQHFDVLPGHTVHHEDSNPLNNMLSNLRVFATQGDHIKYHHSMRDQRHNPITSERRDTQDRYSMFPTITPIWDGSKV